MTWHEGAKAIEGYTAAEVIEQPVSIFYTEEEKTNGKPERNLLGLAK